MSMNKQIVGIVAIIGLGVTACFGQVQPGRFASKAVASLEALNHWAQIPSVPTSHPTVEQLVLAQEQTGRVDACALASVLQDTSYVQELSLDQADELAVLFAYADQTQRGCLEHLKQFLFLHLTNPVSSARGEALTAFYAMAAVSLSHNLYVGRDVEEWAFAQVEQLARRDSNSKRGIWPATVLAVMAEEAGVDQWPLVMGPGRREKFEIRLSKVIRDFDWLQNEPTDYYLVNMKSKGLFSISNQGALVSLFLQANNFFAARDDDSFAKMMVTTGAFNDFIRFAHTGNMQTASAMRFSNDGETFYLAHPTPGTDGKGHFVDSPNGHRHYALAQLVQALCVSYATRQDKQASALIQDFVRRYFETDREGHMVRYLYVPLQAMRSGRELLDGFSLEGWGPQEKALQAQLYGLLKKGYFSSVVCTNVQGFCEVAAEWSVVSKILGVIGRGVKVTFKSLAKTIMKTLPIPTMLHLAVIDLGAKRALRFSKAGIKNFLSQYGWKAGGAATIGAVGVGLRSDTAQPLAR